MLPATLLSAKELNVTCPCKSILSPRIFTPEVVPSVLSCVYKLILAITSFFCTLSSNWSSNNSIWDIEPFRT